MDWNGDMALTYAKVCDRYCQISSPKAMLIYIVINSEGKPLASHILVCTRYHQTLTSLLM